MLRKVLPLLLSKKGTIKVKTSYLKSLSYSKKAQKVVTFKPSVKDNAKISYKITSMKRGTRKITSGFTVTKTGIIKAATKTVTLKVTIK